MPLAKGRFSDFRFDGDYIYFKMEDGDAIVPCVVTVEFLHAIAKKHGYTDQGARAIFVLFRREVEELCSSKYDQGNLRPLIVTADA